MSSENPCSSQDRLETQLNACSLETLYTPTSKSNSYPLIIGCYQLNESKPPEDVESELDHDNDGKPSRSGEIILHSIQKDLQFGNQQCAMDTGSGVLDGKWLQHGPFQFGKDNNGQEMESSYLYATANASGAINVYRLIENDIQEDQKNSTPVMQLKHVIASNVDEDAEDNGLALSLAWDEALYSSSSQNDPGACSTRVVSSYSNGTLALHNIINDCGNECSLSSNESSTDRSLKIEQTHRWNAHTLFGCPSEVWTVCFASNGHYSTYADTVISGGDDCKMKLWDLRLCEESSDVSSSNTTPITVKKDFDAGVTAVSYHPSLEHVFAVGSYDEVVRLWDMRKLDGEPLGQVNVGGGVWRIKWHPKDQSRILVGAMHGGCRLLEVPDLSLTSSSLDMNECNVSVVKEFTEHQSMAYGADWIYDKNGHFDASASCSFYDRQCFIWGQE